MESLLEQATAKNPLAADAWARLAGVKAAFDRDAPAVAAAEKAVTLSRGSSGHHRSLAQILTRCARADPLTQSTAVTNCGQPPVTGSNFTHSVT